MLASQCKTVAVPRALTLRLHSTLWSFQSSRWCAFEQYPRGLHDAQSLVAFFPHTTLTTLLLRPALLSPPPFPLDEAHFTPAGDALPLPEFALLLHRQETGPGVAAAPVGYVYT